MVSLVRPSLRSHLLEFWLPLMSCMRQHPSVVLSLLQVMFLSNSSSCASDNPCGMTASDGESWTDCSDGRWTSAVTVSDWNMISKIQAHSDTQRRELYATGCSASREIEMCGREVVPSSLLRCGQPTPVRVLYGFRWRCIMY